MLGLYVRKARLEFRKLSFEEVCKCYMALEMYSSGLDKLDRTTLPSPTDRRQHSQSSGGSTLVSLFDVEKYLDTQTDKLSGMRPISGRTGTLQLDYMRICVN